MCAQFDRDLFGGQRAEAGGDAVVRDGVVDQRVDHGARGLDGGQGIGAQFHLRTVTCNGHDVLGLQRAGGYGDAGIHEFVLLEGGIFEVLCEPDRVNTCQGMKLAFQ